MTAERVDSAADVVVCGSGVAGLAAACALGGLRLRVLLLDKQRVQRPVAKGELLQPGSIRILRDWDVLRGLEERDAVRINRLVAREADGAELLTIDYGALGGEDAWMLAHDYASILDAIADRLPETVRWRRGVLVEDVITDAAGRIAGVRVTEDGHRYDVRAGLVVAADGMSSRLRKAGGIAASPTPYGHRLLTFEIAGRSPVADELTAYITEHGLHLVYPLPGARTRLYVQVGTDELRTAGRDDLARWCEETLARVPALGWLTGPLRDGAARRQVLPVWRYTAPRLGRPGLALVGEAAHAVHPMAAQGMNTAIADARVLADRLAAAGSAEPVAVDGAVRAYESERLGRLRDIEAMSHNTARMMTSTSRGARLLGDRMLRGTARNPRLRHQTTYNLSGLGMRPLRTIDRLYQLGLLPDRRAHRQPTDLERESE